MLRNFLMAAGKDGCPRIALPGSCERRFCGLRQRHDDLVDDDAGMADDRLLIVNAERPRILRDREILDAARLAGEPRERGKAGGGDDDARNARLLGFRCRPRRGRSAGPSCTVAGDDRIAAALARQGGEMHGMPSLLRRIIATRCMRKLGIRNDPEPRILLLQPLADDGKRDVALEHSVPHLTNGFSGEGVKSPGAARPCDRFLAFGTDDGDRLLQVIAP